MLQAPAIRKKLTAFCKGFDTNAQAARKLKVTAAQLSRALSGKSNVIPAKIVKKLGYQPVIAYVPLGRTATKTVKVNRDAKTGRTVSKAVAKANPATTVTETQRRAVKPRKAPAPKARVHVHTSGHIDAIPDDGRRYHAVEALPQAPRDPASSIMSQESLAAMQEPDHAVIDITARD